MANFPPSLAIAIICMIGLLVWLFAEHCVRYTIAWCRARRLARQIIASYDCPSWGIGHDDKSGFYTGPVGGPPDRRYVRTQLAAEEPFLVTVWDKHSMVVRDKRNLADATGDLLQKRLCSVNYLRPYEIYKIMRPVFARAGYVAIRRNSNNSQEHEMVLPA